MNSFSDVSRLADKKWRFGVEVAVWYCSWCAEDSSSLLVVRKVCRLAKLQAGRKLSRPSKESWVRPWQWVIGPRNDRLVVDGSICQEIKYVVLQPFFFTTAQLNSSLVRAIQPTTVVNRADDVCASGFVLNRITQCDWSTCRDPGSVFDFNQGLALKMGVSD